MKEVANLKSWIGAMGCAVLLGACGGGGSSDGPNLGGADTGTLSGGITDAAIDEVSAVNLRVTALELRQQDAGEDDFITIDLTDAEGNALEFNLLDYQNGEVFPLFENEEVPAGVYEQARLVLEAPAQTPGQCNGQDPQSGSHVELEVGGLVPIFVPSGANNGVRLVSPFRVPANGDAEIIIDFDLRQALHYPPPFDCYFLRPAYRVDVVANTGRITGTVDSTLLDNGNGLCSDDDPMTGNAVYVYEGADQIPGDLDAVDDAEADPYATATVDFDPSAGNTGQGEFVVSFLPPGDYTIAFTCRADQERLPNPDSDVVDEQQADDALDFQQAQNVTVEVGEAAPAEFLP
jgi:hypothetical protein